MDYSKEKKCRKTTAAAAGIMWCYDCLSYINKISLIDLPVESINFSHNLVQVGAAWLRQCKVINQK